MADKAQVAWPKSSPRSHGLDAGRLRAWCEDLASRNTKGLLVVRGDRIVYEWHAPGTEATYRHPSASLAKALVGGMALLVALTDHRLGIDDRAAQFIPAWQADPVKSQITIRHLATHSSGIEDAETPGKGHFDQGGWKERFWRRQPDPFTIALYQAPVLFPPGTRMAYSNPGFAALAYAITASLKGGAQADIRALLAERIFEPLGVPPAAWTIGYEQPSTVDGMRLYGTWGGGTFTVRAAARVGQLMLHDGVWQGRQLVDPAWLKRMISPAGTPPPDRQPGEPAPMSGLCWWVNADGVWSSLPRDAFAGAGAGHQLLLVIPSLDLIVVRNGESLTLTSHADGFWNALNRHIFGPLMDCFLDHRPGDLASAPYPRSSVIRGARFAPVSSIVRKAFHSDNWPLTWGSDGHLYTAYGDGRGFEPYVEQTLGLGFARVIGSPEDIQGTNLRSATGENAGYGAQGAKASGLLMVAGHLYMWVRNVHNSQLAWSSDHGQTWSWSDWKFTESFGCPTFLNFGPDFTGARDEYVYVYSHDGDSAYEPADHMVLARVPQESVADRARYGFFQSLDHAGRSVWTPDIRARGAVFVHKGCCLRSSITYSRGLDRYLWWQQIPRPGADTRFRGGFGIYDAPEPWGPWSTMYFTLQWDTGPGETGSLPTKWMSPDGRTAYLVFSGYDTFSVRKVVFARARYAALGVPAQGVHRSAQRR